MKELTDHIERTSANQLKKALKTSVAAACTPSLGSASKKELELFILEALVDIGFLSDSPSIYEMVQKLRITRSRARSLMYERELRRQTPESLDSMARQALRSPLLQNQQYAIAVEIENPYLADHIRDKVRRLGHLTDGSFSPSLIRLSPKAAALLVEDLLKNDKAAKKRANKALAKVGGEDKSFSGRLTKAISLAASAVGGKAAGVAVEQGASFLGDVLEGNMDKISEFIQGVLNREDIKLSE